MLFTVIQYLPILEEESPSHGLELAKKTKENCDADGDDDPEGQDDDPDPDATSDIDYFPISHFVYTLNHDRFFRHQDTGWQHHHGNVSTPPPQI